MKKFIGYYTLVGWNQLKYLFQDVKKKKNTDCVISEHYTIFLDNVSKTAFTSTFINFPNTEKKLMGSNKYENYNDNYTYEISQSESTWL